jgi:hypothetical protein
MKKTFIAVLGLVLLNLSCAGQQEKPTHHAPAIKGKKNPLPLPSTVPLVEYEKRLYQFLEERHYDDQPGHLNWDVDKHFRDTGPYVNGVGRGTHPAVRIWYSPGIMQWLLNGRKGAIPDNAMMVKEMIQSPAARYQGKSEAWFRKNVRIWTVMVKDSQGAQDGWFWSIHGGGGKVDSHEYPFAYPESGFGNYCTRCHASAEKEMTFADLENIKGYHGEVLTYYVDDSWRDPPKNGVKKEQKPAPPRAVNPDFLSFFPAEKLSHGEPLAIPPVTHDHVWPKPGEQKHFMTSDQCLPCHSGQAGKNRSNMFRHPTEDKPAFDFSPHGEWRWSPMGLAGRDPIFYAQLESELAQHPKHAEMIQNTCFSCHGAMGQRQLALDHPERKFDQSMVYQVDPKNPDSVYAALARDGVSCALCHHIAEDKRPVKELFTGNLQLGPADALYGPYDDVQTKSMTETTGLKPVGSPHVKSARMCASCHTVLLPVFNKEGEQVGEFLEQATYPEWLNSAYQNEYGQGSDVKTCQDCHMPNTLDGKITAGRIANVQDDQYPQTTARAPLVDLTVKYREGFSRHRLLGLNALLLTMFEQNDRLLGMRKKDFMTSSSEGLANALRGIDQIAQNQTATLSIDSLSQKSGLLEAAIKITSKVGHRFPSGVGFRRAFVEFVVLDGKDQVIWGSGQTNSVGAILGGQGEVLGSETHEGGAYQPHHEVIERQDQVQIYEELVQNPYGEFTTGFLDIKKAVKDNRFLPKGWTLKGPKGFPWAKETAPHGKAEKDKDFTDGTGSDVIRYRIKLTPAQRAQARAVRATLFYQSAPPGYLKDRFAGAKGPATQRLYNIASHLQVKGTRLDGWKLKIVGDKKAITRTP